MRRSHQGFSAKNTLVWGFRRYKRHATGLPGLGSDKSEMFPEIEWTDLEIRKIPKAVKRLRQAVDFRAFRGHDDETDRVGREGLPQPARPRLRLMNRLKHGIEPVIVDQVESTVNAIVTGASREEKPVGWGASEALKQDLEPLPVRNDGGRTSSPSRHSHRSRRRPRRKRSAATVCATVPVQRPGREHGRS